MRLGRGGGADLVFLTADDDRSLSSRSTTGARDDLRQITALLEGFRALGTGRVLQEVLALVLDAAIEISGAERAFIMLSTAEGGLEFRLARGRDKQTLTDSTFAVSRKIPEEVFRTGTSRVVADLLDGGFADVHMGTVALGIRNVVCVPLNFVHYVESAEARGEDRRIGVLYLDSRERGHAAVGRDPGGARDARRRGVGGDRERAALPRKAREGQDGAGDADRGRDPAGAPAQAARQHGLRRGRGRQPAVPVDRGRLLRLPRRAGPLVRIHARRRRRQGAARRAHERTDAGDVRVAGAVCRRVRRRRSRT